MNVCYMTYHNLLLAGYFHRVQLLRMALNNYHEPVIFMDVLFSTWRFFASINNINI